MEGGAVVSVSESWGHPAGQPAVLTGCTLLSVLVARCLECAAVASRVAIAAI